MGFAITGYSLTRIPPCFPLLGVTLLICSCEIVFSPVGGLLLFSFLGGLHVFVASYSHMQPDLKIVSTALYLHYFKIKPAYLIAHLSIIGYLYSLLYSFPPGVVFVQNAVCIHLNLFRR